MLTLHTGVNIYMGLVFPKCMHTHIPIHIQLNNNLIAAMCMCKPPAVGVTANNFSCSEKQFVESHWL